MAPSWAKPPDVAAPPFAWWDAADKSSIVLATPPAVTRWLDKSGYRRDLPQTTVASQPRTDRVVNGLNALDFVTDDVLNDTLIPVDPASMTCFAVVVLDTLSATIDATVLQSLNGQVQMLVRQSTGQPSGGEVYCYAGGAAVAFAPSIPVVGATDVYTTKLAGASSVTRKNGVAGATASIGALTDTGVTVGSQGANASPMDGAICEILLYNVVLSDEDCQKIEAYLTDKWIKSPSRTIVSDPTRATARRRRR